MQINFKMYNNYEGAEKISEKINTRRKKSKPAVSENVSPDRDNTPRKNIQIPRIDQYINVLEM